MESSIDAAHRAGAQRGAGRTVAQLGCLVLGGALVAAGVLGFFFGGSSFHTGNNPPGKDFIVFQVNGWHNVVHIATGAFLILMAPKARSAVTGLLIFGAAYAAVTIWGFVDGNDVIGLIPVDTADNWLHVAITVAALLAAFAAGGLAAAGRRNDPRVRPARST
jgi:hypothetical protein